MKQRHPVGARRPAAPSSPAGPRDDHGGNRFITLARLLTTTDRLATLLPAFHQHAVEAVEGTCSVLLQFEPRGGRLYATSAFAVDHLPADPWPQTPEEAQLLERLMGEERAVSIASDRAPGLATTLQTDGILLVPLIRLQERLGVLAIGVPAMRVPASAVADVEGVCHALVLALHETRAYRDAELQRELRTLLHEFSRTVSSSLILATGLEAFCEGANRLFAGDRTSVWLHDREACEMVLEASSDASYLARGGRVSTDAVAFAASDGLRREQAAIGSTLPDEDEGNATGVVTIPLKGRRRALGTLILERVRIDPGAELELLARADEVGRQLSAAIENVQLLEDVLRKHRELENTFNSLMDLVVVSDRSGRIVHANLALAERTGKTREALVGRPIEEVIGPDMAKLVSGFWLEGHEDEVTAVTCEIDDPGLNGVFSVTVTRLHGESSESLGLVLIARDITPHAQLEAERADLLNRLTQSEKLAALGQLVAGIAHELNNPLQGALGHLELLRATGAFPKALRRDVRQIYRETDRAAKIVRNLLVFAGSRKLARRRLSMNAVATRALALRAQACKASGIEVLRHYDEGLPRVLGDPVLLQQALLNVILNAEQAIGDRGGRIEVATTLDTALDRIVTTVRDTGPGIELQVLPHVFEPFYTTKDVGQGTGLGLAVAYGIIQEHGGEIVATNHQDGGALFTIALPVGRS